jgi:hypothetical protein
MPDSINTYIKAIQAALRDSPFVHDPKISVDDRGEVWFLRADIYFIMTTHACTFVNCISGAMNLTRKTIRITTKKPMGR